ncbi:hypothetical protein ACL02U_28475 [Streptomyces sp. MS06]|uniref:Rv1733c family protein n=1 Tax=Streptomyces sp. MS06 TaxID=3385974 RepID=UPI0039A21011
MSGRQRTTKALWRWRGNPLRRRDDVIEAWVVLAVWLVVLVGGTLVGLVSAHAADAVFAEQRDTRHPTRAVLVTDAPRETGSVGSSARTSAAVRWTTPDGTVHTGRTLVRSGLPAGATVEVWLDSGGALTTRPASSTEASVEAAVFGGAAALGLAGLAWGTGAVVRWRLDRRRIDAWGSEWAVVEPGWSHKTG